MHCSWNVTIARHLRMCAGREKISVEEPGHVGKDCPFVGACGCTAAESLSKASRLRIDSNGDPHMSLRVLFP